MDCTYIVKPVPTGSHMSKKTRARHCHDQVKMRHLAKGKDGEWVPQEKPVYCPEGMVSWASQWPSDQPHLLFGHDAVRGLQIHPNATGLDGGCLYGKRLIALKLPSREIFWVDAKKQYVVGSAPIPSTSTGGIGSSGFSKWIWPVAVALTAAAVGTWIATRRIERHDVSS